MTDQKKAPFSIRRIGGYLHRVAPVMDGTGKVIHHVVTPLMVELRYRDIMQIIVGATILAIPVGFTEEVWKLGESLSNTAILALAGISVSFIASFVYFNFYRRMLRGFVFEYIKRVAAIYIVSLFVVGSLLTLIGQCPWGIDNVLAVKRILIVAFPASMSAAVSDMVK